MIDSVGMEAVQELLRPFLGGSAQPAMLNMMNNMTVMRIIGLICGAMHIDVTKEQLLDLNAELNKIKLLWRSHYSWC